ncbi:MAG: hypothetical protein HN366_17290 [Deltaproteobacteria bacterium]|nr:hypothetical protein [Deltaproteobacteria bacterium]
MDNTLRKNEKCFIGMPACGYGYESAKLCFVACPSHEKYTLKIETIKDIVESYQYECHIALKRIDPGTFAFCTKICSKIIQSHFCIVFLDPSYDTNGDEYPNPNVHFEYGMMVSQNKHIIPLQDEQFDLAFNISPLDTIKYNDSNFKTKVTDTIKYAIKRSAETELSGAQPAGPELFTFYNLCGFQLSDININFFKLLYAFGSNLGFFIFDNRNLKTYKFLGTFDYEEPKLAILHTKLLIDNITSTYKDLMSGSSKEDEKKIDFSYLVNSVTIDLIISPFYDKSDILQRIKNIATNEFDYSITIYYRNDFRKYIDNKYKEIGIIEPIKTCKT